MARLQIFENIKKLTDAELAELFTFYGNLVAENDERAQSPHNRIHLAIWAEIERRKDGKNTIVKNS